MKLYSINTNYFKLDGGAMFGVVPKSIWSRTNPADNNNMCTWALRCLLIEDGDRLILVDCGIGDKQTEKFFGYFYLHGDDSLDKSLAKHGFHRDDITDVFLTHLHFDHCGGAYIWNDEHTHIIPAFKNAHFWSNQSHWDWAVNPNPREKASFLKENLNPLEESGQLNFVKRNGALTKEVFNQVSVLFVDGHTESQMIPIIKYKGETIVFAADLLPSTGHIPLPYVMGYDTRPLITLDEKAKFLDDAATNQHIIFLEHDAVNECCTLKHTDRGVRLDRVFPLNEVG